jgi:epoxyqueuosine reductase
MHASMLWMERGHEKRGDPARLLPGCRSVVAFAMGYDVPGPALQRGSRPGRVARYARGRDYHKVLGRKLRGLAAWLEEASGCPSRAFVDTAPVLERAWAQRAGLGWIGKNANLLSREIGSWFLLGEILTAAELEPGTEPHPDHCGSCTACVDACPTKAIVADGVVDSRRCIAYWTIEHRGPVPVSMRPGIGDWIFGCDVCQEVCPWNRRDHQLPREDRLERRADLVSLEPREILAMDEATFRARFSGTSLMRARWDGMRRNACIVLGNGRRAGAVAALGRGLADGDPMIRAHAAWALGRIGGEAATRQLGDAGRDERDPEVRREIERALSEAER